MQFLLDGVQTVGVSLMHNASKLYTPQMSITKAIGPPVLVITTATM